MKPNQRALAATVLAVVVLCALLLAPMRRAAQAPSPERDETAGPVQKEDRPAPAPRQESQVLVEERAGEGSVLVEAPIDPDAAIATLLAKRWDVTKPEVREEFLNELQRLQELRAAQTVAKAGEFGLPLVTEAGSVLAGFSGEMPLYDISHNEAAAISTATDLVRQTVPYEVAGNGHQIGLWDVGYAPREDHQELDGRIDVRDNASPNGLHATHVAATMIGEGIDPLAKGMAPQAKIWAYSSTDMLIELAADASTDDGDFGGLTVSVHPYGAAAGWENGGAAWYGNFSDDGNPGNDFVSLFGQYSASAAAWDGLASIFPYHLMIKSSGNHANDEPPGSPAGGEPQAPGGAGGLSGELLSGQADGDPVDQVEPGAPWSLNGTSTVFNYDPATHPEGDGKQYNVSPQGFGTIDGRASAKNILTVGSVADAVTGGIRDLAKANLSDFSSAGPTDDGRIKPDVVANGESVYSANGQSTNWYFASSGTSMAAASAGGSALLLVDLQKDLSGKGMRASTLKGLLIHTADDRGNPGPDYRFGWGLMNVERAAQFLLNHGVLGDTDRRRFVEESLVSASDNDYFVVDHDGLSPLRVTLSWTDAPGQWTTGHENRTPRLVNDLNLRLVGPNGTTHYPYVMPFSTSFDPADLDAPATTGVNTVDNVEQIFLGNPPAGRYTIHVDLAGALTGAAQDYSVLVSGTALAGVGVEVVAPVPDQRYLVFDTSKIDNVTDLDLVFSDPALVFSGDAHVFGVSWTPSELLSDVTIAGDGKVDLFPTATAFGPVEITVTAQDAAGGFASDTFTVVLGGPTIYVNANTPAAPAEQNGIFWATAFRHLQDALQWAVDGQEIWVAQGVYYPDVDNAGDSDSRERSFAIVGGVSLYGGFVGGETSRANRDPSLHPTILSGDVSQDDSQQPIATRTQANFGDENNSYRVVDMIDAANDNVFDGFVVTAGRADQFPDRIDGAGVFATKDVQFRDCWFTGNYASGNGGAIFIDDHKPVFAKCRFTGNEASLAGGGIYDRKSDAKFYNCEIRGNRASDGGGVWIGASNLLFVNCLISGNNGFFGGGGIHMTDGKLQVINTTITGNFAFGGGGGLNIRGVKLDGDGKEIRPIFQNVILWNNEGGGTTSSVIASVAALDKKMAPFFHNCIVANSIDPSDGKWDDEIGKDEDGNLDLDPLFRTPAIPSSLPSEGGDLRLRSGSPALNAGQQVFLLADEADLDGDGDTGEQVPIDLAGYPRLISSGIDMGALEYGNPVELDGDNDGLSDAFEETYGDENGELDPMSDLDGDGLMAQAEFLHGLDPTAPLEAQIVRTATMEYLGSTFLTVTFDVNPAALLFMDYHVERRSDPGFALGWRPDQTIEVSAVPSPSNPDLIEVTHRSLVPMGSGRAEFLRVGHSVLGAAGP